MKKATLLLILSVTILSTSFSQTTRYVSTSASNLGDGSSWTNASDDLQAMINISSAGDIVKVASGTYTPSGTPLCSDCPSDDRYHYFLIDTSIVLQGSYDPLTDLQDYNTPSILSGEINGSGVTDNILQVLVMVNAGAPRIDGFVIEKGYAVPPSLTGTTIASVGIPRERGGACINYFSTPHFSNMIFRNNHGGSSAVFANGEGTFTHCLFKDNTASNKGAALEFLTGDMTLEHVDFINNQTENTANDDGGAIHFRSASRVTMKYCKFLSNESKNKGGGAIHSEGKLFIYNCVFADNKAKLAGGGLHAIDSDSVEIVNTVFHANKANVGGSGHHGGAIYNENSGMQIINTTFHKNEALSGEGIHCKGNGSTEVFNTIFAEQNDDWSKDGSASLLIDYSIVDTINGGNHNTIGENALFVDALSPAGSDGQWMTADDGLRIKSISPAYSAADNSKLPLDILDLDKDTNVTETIPYDIIGNPRVFNTTTDMGAYENQTILPNILYVKPTATGTGDGTSWANASNALQAVINAASADDTIKVASGTYTPSGTPQCSDCPNDNRYHYFLIDTSIVLQGSYDPLIDLQDYNAPSILNGEINGSGVADNILQVLIMLNAGEPIIDGFVIEKGYAVPSGISNTTIAFQALPRERGAACLYTNSIPHFSNMVFRNNYGGSSTVFGNGGGTFSHCLFKDNTASNKGAALEFLTGNMTLEHVDFINNRTENAANDDGGAIHFRTASRVTMKHCKFLNNESKNKGGGAIHTEGKLFMHNCVFADNKAKLGGGGLHAIDSDSIEIVNTVFHANKANTGGGIFSTNASMQIINTTFHKNTASAGDGIHCESSTAKNINIFNTIFAEQNDDWSKEGSASLFIDYSIVDTTSGGNQNIIGVNPYFANTSSPSGLDGKWMTADDGLRLSPCSPAYNAGLDSVATIPIDIVMADRILLGQVDIGAYESATDTSIYQGMTRFYVDSSNVSGIEDGLSWATAFTRLQDALQPCIAGSIAEVWVAKGTYYPDEGSGQVDNDRNAAYYLPNGVAIYGGFLGTEVSLHQRDWMANHSILSGEIQQDDNIDNNSRGVVKIIDNSNTTRIDGITIRRGRYDGGTIGAGGLYARNSPVEVMNCAFTNNIAVIYEKGSLDMNVTTDVFCGGGILIGGAVSADIRQCTFTNNAAAVSAISKSFGQRLDGEDVYTTAKTYARSGGGIFIRASATVDIHQCIFTNNAADAYANADGFGGTVEGEGVYTTAYSYAASGGGIFIRAYAFADIRQCIFTNNAADAYANAFASAEGYDNREKADATSVAHTGGVIFTERYTSAEIHQCTFTNNAAAADVDVSASAEDWYVSHSAFSGGGIFINFFAPVNIFNSIICQNTATADDFAATDILIHGTGTRNIRYNLLESYPGDSTNIIGVDPGFLDPGVPATSSSNLGTVGDYRLRDTSAAINVGYNGYTPLDIHDVDMDGDSTEYLPYDLDGNPRIHDSRVDMGAYENQTCPSKIYVDATKSYGGRSWQYAYPTLEKALSSGCSTSIDTVFVAKGAYAPLTTDRAFLYDFSDKDIVIKGGYNTGGITHDPSLYPTVISGDIGLPNDHSDNLYHAFYASGNGSVTLQDLTITGGKADGTVEHEKGAGVYADTQVTLENVTIEGNTGNDAESRAIYVSPLGTVTIKQVVSIRD